MTWLPRFINTVLGVVASVLVAILVIEIRLPNLPADPRPEALPAANTLPLSNAAVPVEKLVAAILARPIFAATRRPSDVATASLPRLIGTVISPAGRSALFAPADAAHPLVLHEGDPIGKLVIRAIAPGLVDAAGAGERVQIRVNLGLTPILEATQTGREPPTAHSQGVVDGRQE